MCDLEDGSHTEFPSDHIREEKGTEKAVVNPSPVLSVHSNPRSGWGPTILFNLFPPAIVYILQAEEGNVTPRPQEREVTVVLTVFGGMFALKNPIRSPVFFSAESPYLVQGVPPGLSLCLVTMHPETRPWVCAGPL